MSRCQRFKFLLLYLKGLRGTPLQTPTPNPFPSTFSLKYSSLTSEQHSFTVSYLINNCGFSSETALKASKRVRFETPQKPDSVIAVFRSNGFTNTQISRIVRTAPNVLTCDPHKRVLPKFEYLRSKGASSFDIVQLVCRSPRILYCSLENSVIPAFESVRRILQSDKETIRRLLSCCHFFGHDLAVQNVRLLLDNGVSDSNINFLLRRRPSVILSYDMREAIDEVKGMGFETSKCKFVIALLAKRAVSKSGWDAKVEALKSWGWSEEMVLDTFRRQPLLMLVSKDKINRVMGFWVNQLGRDSLALARRPEMFAFSLEKRIIPRAFVVQYLIAKGLLKKSGNLFSPFVLSEKLFRERYVNRFKEERCQLLKLYQEKMNVQ
ncbi:Mitochodrial transcription termination factor-related [Spatholobus suberectus]|nr:Mitochodrial transcription termination factor-related [Spatholobus suberectus]